MITRRTLPGAEGVSLSVLEAGPPNGPLTLLLHGFPEDALSWRAQIDALAAAGLRVVAPDQRGYGGSDKPVAIRAYMLDLLAADILAIADHLRAERFHLVGHDWGGVVAWRLAAHHPTRLDRLAILNAPHPDAVGAYLLRSPRQILRSAYILAFQPPRAPERLLGMADFRMLTRALRRSSRPGAFSDAELERLRAMWSRPGAMTAMLNWYRALRFMPARGGRGRIAAPTLILWGLRDAFLESGLAEAAAALCERPTVLRLEVAGHWLQHEEAEIVSSALIDFLKPNGPEPGSSSGPPPPGS